ncbi:hypothetical protein [Nocardioides panaciterrulae]|uniref:DUF3168 domain-containing protein n=1 Tax=Nocardioides panaciterrulae TaxID=661492 RepID=A0A7Y9JE82_9ACTN|nr:hypothetical protein [Nocardioides panaciterrulae]NYD43935.1 hypothetical protein [Nocardioides panaciterrulae]NYD44004.1 hypothetical protein [Nocardioides panaciterrulae]
MSALVAKRTELKDALTAAGYFAFSTVPEIAQPPMVYVAPAEPYISLEGAAFGGVIVHHQIVVVAGPGVNEQRADELDGLVEGVLFVIADLVGLFEVGRPGSIELSGQAYIAVAITTQTEIQLEAS